MKFKKIFIIITPIILTLVLISIFYILFFNDLNIQNPNDNLENSLNNNEENNGSIGNNEDDLILGQEENAENFPEIPISKEGNPDDGLNIEVDGFKYCRYDEECFNNLFLECNIGNYLKFVNEDLPYSFSIINKNKDNCLLLIQNLTNTDLENINCSFPLEILNNENFNKILTLDNKVLNNYCEYIY